LLDGKLITLYEKPQGKRASVWLASYSISRNSLRMHYA
jgi:hypothetical protein